MIDIMFIRSKYLYSKGLPVLPTMKPKRLNFNLSKHIADCFDEMKHEPTNETVLEAYEALKNELIEQYKFILSFGYTCKIFDGTGEPYKNSDAMRDDVLKTKTLTIFATENGFGDMGILDNPLLEKTDFFVGNHQMLVNDIFRFVHDIFGHCVYDNSFGQIGEDVAWWSHYTMFSELAGKALTTETRGQNSWVNFGKHLRNEKGDVPQSIREKGYIHPSLRPYADQKIGLLPSSCFQLNHYY